MIEMDRDTTREVELAWLFAFLAELGHERGTITITIIIIPQLANQSLPVPTD